MNHGPVLARLVVELDGITDADDAVSPARLDSYRGEFLGTRAWDIGVARNAALRATTEAQLRVAERDCDWAAVTLDMLGEHEAAVVVRTWAHEARA